MWILKSPLLYEELVQPCCMYFINCNPPFFGVEPSAEEEDEVMLEIT